MATLLDTGWMMIDSFCLTTDELVLLRGLINCKTLELEHQVSGDENLFIVQAQNARIMLDRLSALKGKLRL